jgi:hypothetical protein
LRPALLERRIVQKRVWARVQNFVRQWRWLGQVARNTLDLTCADAAQDSDQATEVHRLVYAILDGLAHQRMVGNLSITGDVLETRCCIRKCCGEQIVRLHPLQLRRHLLASAIARDRQRDRGVPAPARPEHGRIEQRLYQDVPHGIGVQKSEDVFEGKRVLWAQRQEQPIFGRCGLKFEVELATKALSECQAPRTVDAASERRVNDQLHPARLVEKPLRHDDVLRGQCAQRAARFD